MFEKADRETQQTAILAQIYVLSCGDPAISGRDDTIDYAFEKEVARKLGLTLEVTSKRVQHLVLSKGLLTWRGGGGAELTRDGSLEIEDQVRGWVAADKPKTLLSRQYEACLQVVKLREWERYQVLRNLNDLADSEPTEYVDYDELSGSVGFEASLLHTTIDYLSSVGLLNIPESRSFQITDPGIKEAEALEDRLQALGHFYDLSLEEFMSVIEAVWKMRYEGQVVQTEIDFQHSPDYSWVKWNDQEFTLPGRPAKVISLLHRAHRAKQPNVEKAELLRLLGYDQNQRVQDAFKPNHIRAWKTLVRSPGRGVYQLNI